MASDRAIWVYSPANLRGTGLLTQAAAAGAVPVLDLNETAPAHWGALWENLELLREEGFDGPLGFRAAVQHLPVLLPLVKNFTRSFFILAGATDVSALAVIRQCPQYRFYAEAYSVETLRNIDAACIRDNIDLAGFVAVAAEAGGRTGQRPAFLLLHELGNATSRSVFIRGGIGVHTAGALALTDLAGLVLDDQVLLMPGSPLTKKQQEQFSHIDGREFGIIGEDDGALFSLPRQPWALAAQDIIRREPLAASTERTELFIQLAERIRFGDPAHTIWPLGQMAGRAQFYRKKFKNLHGLVSAIHLSLETAPALALQAKALTGESPMALEHGTTFGIVQGPMTRVSDSPRFARAVADSGALPFVALALLKDKTLTSLLEQTKETLGDKSWGVGILGFVPADLREEQIREVLRIRPPFALIAGGHPDHARQLEEQGIRTYLHVPTPSLLRTFIKQGSRRFIFEGRECGGHVGPYNSFPLWEQMIDTLLEDVAPQSAGEYSILFAGGIHDALSSAVVAALAAPLSARGFRTGILMGTAYLATKEAVEAGAITPAFQQAVIGSTQTTLLVSGPGHANRCVVSPFSDEFKKRRKELLQQDRPPEEISTELDGLLLGRLRVASKGIQRAGDGNFTEVAPSDVHGQGMFMAGDVAPFLSKTTTCAELHREVSSGAQARVAAAAESVVNEKERSEPVNIAIVGISVLVPGAQTTDAFWDTIINKKQHLREIPADRWDWRLLFDEDRQAEDKINSRWGGFIDDLLFDPLPYGIPPKSVPNIATSQLLALENVRWALEDAGIDTATMDRENTSVIFATADSGGFLANSLVVRSSLPFFSDADVKDARTRTPEWTEETFPGILCNVVPGRVANRLDFGGRNYAVDAACASSLVAVDLAVRELTSRRSGVVIAGGIDVGQTPFGYLAFSKTGALSPTGDSLPFDKKANGIVISEGSAVLILKRLDDAEKDGDKIYAVIKGIAGSSDGRAMGLTAPRSEGQQLSLVRAYDEAGFSAATIDLYEAHGTGTVVGDNEELDTICRTLKAHEAAPGSVTLGSVKSLIGHTKMAAGMVSLAKTALSLYYKVLPPHAHVTEPLDKVLDEQSPVCFHGEAMPWLKKGDHPRRAGISAFGFGGANFHTVLEEHGGYETASRAGGEQWPAELFVFAAASPEALINELEGLARQLSSPVDIRLQDLAWSLVRKFSVQPAAHRLCFAAASPEDLSRLLQQSIDGLKTGTLPAQVMYNRVGAEPPKVAFLFSGQGAQYLHMGREAALYFPAFRRNAERANALLAKSFSRRLSDHIFPARTFEAGGTAAQEAALNNTHVAQPAIGLVSTGLLDIFTRLDAQAQFFAGHSFGELTALHAAGVFSREDLFRLAEFRGRMMAGGGDAGTMAAVIAPRERIEDLIKQKGWNLVVANHNGPEQVVISGAIAEIKKATEELTAMGMRSIALPVSGAFHSPLMDAARGPLNEFIAAMELHKPAHPVFSNTTGKPYPEETESIRALLFDHLLRPVEFMAQVQEMYAAGARIFIELGPGRVLTGLVDRILGDRPHVALAADGPMAHLLSVLGRLWIEGASIELSELFRDRSVTALDLNALAQDHGRPAPKPTDWIINGHGATPVNPAFGSKLPKDLLTADRPQKQKTMEQETTGQPPAPQAAPMPQYYAYPDPVMAAYQSYQETMRQFLRTQEQVMRAFLGGEALPASELQAAPIAAFQAMPPPPMMQIPVQQPYAPQTYAQPNGNGYAQAAPAAPVQIPAPVQMAALTATTPEAIAALLTSIISERTGYPESMIGLDLDLERELGVDSIKRMEIFGKLLSSLPKGRDGELTTKADRFVRIKKFRDLVDALAQELGGAREAAVTLKQA